MSRFPMLIACFILCFVTIPTLAHAQPTLQVVPETTTPAVGEIVSFQITVTDANDLTNISCIFDESQPDASSFYNPILSDPDEFETDYAYTSPGPKTATCELRDNFGAVLTDPVVMELTVEDGLQVFLPLIIQ
ncbi:MAG: hypothetical protein AAGF95_11525 [Chloroflexota bacterium]